jgi:type I restriction enzyme S subunit
VASTGFAVLTPKQSFAGSFLYHHVMSPRFVQFLEDAATGQAYPAVRPTDVKAYRLPLPAPQEQQAIGRLLDSVNAAIDQERENRMQLESLKASAAETLLTGKISTTQEKDESHAAADRH